MEWLLQITWYIFLYIFSSYRTLKQPSARVTFIALPLALDVCTAFILSSSIDAPFLNIFLDVLVDVVIFIIILILNGLNHKSK